ncbi:hypothetical protein J3D47_002203 [Pseudomonas laurylsulfativorans]|nr:hypothetical protein [Pseudomonas laurylsulfativorans]
MAGAPLVSRETVEQAGPRRCRRNNRQSKAWRAGHE